MRHCPHGGLIKVGRRFDGEAGNAGLQFAFLEALWFHESYGGVYGSGPRNSERENLGEVFVPVSLLRLAYLMLLEEPDGRVDLQGDLLVYLFDSKSPPSGRLSLIARYAFWRSVFLYQNLGASSSASSSYPWEDLPTEPDLLDPGIERNPEMLLGFEGRFWSPEAALDPAVTFRTRRLSKDPEVIWEPRGPGGRIRTRMSFGNPEVPSDPEDPETAWGPEGTILCLPRQDCSWYLFGFRILPLGSWPLSSSYVVFYFCGKSLTSLEGAGVGVMTQVPAFAAFHVWRSRVLTAPWTPMRLRLHKGFRIWHVSYDAPCVRPESKHVSSSGSTFALYVICSLPESKRISSSGMDAGVEARASLKRNLEAGVLPEAWMIFPNQFASYFSISSSNSGNNLCTQVNRSCSFSAGFPWTGHRSSNPSFPGGSWPEVVLSGWASTPACRWQVLWAWREQDVALKSPFLGRFRILALHVDGWQDS
ncbi:hypothetical protein F2Q69_00005975 [Brassica cretica]|uniref:Uncharacterized protein n=1 Tax=Brassica cretica TaxID=69181 RepID=A0A8S9P1V8_BRACR|nr:hypothetical protein F2Q69_00005975 [Brassica cretica]